MVREDDCQRRYSHNDGGHGDRNSRVRQDRLMIKAINHPPAEIRRDTTAEPRKCTS